MGVGSGTVCPYTLDPRREIRFHTPPPSAELDARPRDGTCRAQDGGDAAVSRVRQLTVKKMSTMDCWDREIQQIGCVPQIPQQVHPKPSEQLSAESVTAQEHHQLLYRAERRARESGVVPGRITYRPVSTTAPLRMQDLEAILELAKSARPVPTE